MSVRFCLALLTASYAVAEDYRDIQRGSVIYEHGYCDQPYVVVMPDGTWLCTFTTSAEREGAKRQWIVATRSSDRGATWSNPIPIEPPKGPEASWVMPLLTDFGRVYAFYDYNGDRIATLPDGTPCRADMLGWYCYKYSDDGGRTWSERYRLPVRVTACDRGNNWGGDVQIMWGIGKPVRYGDTAWFGFTKLGRYMLEDGEGWFFRSDNIFTERDPARLHWEMLPDGDHGLRAPEFGSVQEEHNLVPLSDGSLYCVYRTTKGYPVESYSRDGGRTWSHPQIMRYADGRPIKHPRACPRLWRTQDGRYLFWFHNHGGRDYSSRNPAWISGGIERDGRIAWSQPEIVLYGDDLSDATGRFSYPDLVQEDGRYWVTTTQKTRATVHEIPAALFESLWAQFGDTAALRERPVWQIGAEEAAATLPDLGTGGFSIAMRVRLETLRAGDTLFDTRDDKGRGVSLRVTHAQTLAIALSDGNTTAEWDTDADALSLGRDHAIVVIVDGGPNIVSFVVDGKLLDGGEQRQYGWGRFSPELTNLNGGVAWRIGRDIAGTIAELRVYDRYLTISEAVAYSQEER